MLRTLLDLAELQRVRHAASEHILRLQPLLAQLAQQVNINRWLDKLNAILALQANTNQTQAKRAA